MIKYSHFTGGKGMAFVIFDERHSTVSNWIVGSRYGPLFRPIRVKKYITYLHQYIYNLT